MEQQYQASVLMAEHGDLKMASIVIQESGQPDRVFHLSKREIIVGRGRAADLILPHTTVSKKHLKMTIEGTEYSVENISKGNTLLVNGQITNGSQTIEHRATLQVGRYSLVLYGNNLNPMERFHEGNPIDELPIYARTSQANRTDNTFQMSPAMVQKTLKQGNLIRNARITTGTDVWTPGDKKLIFGKGADVPISGFFTGSNVAELEWDGGSHVLKKTGVMTKVLINGTAVSNPTALNEGDHFSIGGKTFQYLLKSTQ